MRQEAWRSILSATDDIDRLVAAAVGDYPDSPPPAPSTGQASTSAWQDPSRQQASWQTPAWQSQGGSAAAAPGDGEERLDWTETAERRAPSWTPTRPGSESSVPSEQERQVLDSLHQDAASRITRLRSELASEPGREHAVLALVLFYDERIMGLLPEYLRLSWPLLQTRFTRARTGGDDFFRFIDDLLRDPTTPSFVFEVYYYCLTNGFTGRYANNLEALEQYRVAVQQAIVRPEPSAPQVESGARHTSVAAPRPWYWYYGAAAVFVVMLTASMTLLSNCSC